MCQLDDTHAIAGQTPAWKHEELSKNLNKKHDKLRQRGTQNGLNDSHGYECLSVFSYGPEPALEKSSLSIRLMHKPPRAQKELEKASNPTRRNSLTNSITPQDTQYDIISPTDHPPSQDTSGCASPSNLTPSGSPTQPNLVRKKSGEIVKPLLKDRASSISLRSRSLPSTPTYKQVHFGGDNDVRYFKKKDRPTAISAQSSPKPVEIHDDDEEADIPSLEFDLQADRHMRSLFNPNRKSYFEYYDEELNSHVDHEEEVVTRTTQGSKSSSSEDWQLALLNFPNEPNSQENIEIGKPVFLENIFLSTDKRYLLGRIAVLNLAYQKSVTIRYSLDNWCTIVEIQATYIPDCPALLRTHNYERFMFKIPLDSFFNGFYTSVDPLSNSHSELCPELCVKYVVHGQELWDNNQGGNYRFKLKKEPNLQIMSAEVPNSARTKQEVHKKRPKYSSSYLKRIKSDSALSHNMGTMSLEDSSYVSSKLKDPASQGLSSEKSQERGMASSGNDFEDNQYYLSSPLFSSLAKREKDSDLQKHVPKNLDEEMESGRPLSPFPTLQMTGTNATNSNTRNTSRKFQPETDTLTLPRMTRNLHEPMSYKDFLDSYCFFNSNFNDNSSKTTLVMSDHPSAIYDSRTTTSSPNASSQPIYTVSSFLS